MDATPHARLFLGIPVPEDARCTLESGLRDALGAQTLPGRPVPPRNWHLTLRFLGDSATAAASGLRDALRRSDLGERFALRLAGVGAFPRAARASVLWCGVAEGAAPLTALAARVDAYTLGAGWSAEARPFTPHLTLARLRAPADLRALLPQLASVGASFEVREVVLFRSSLAPGAARYDAVERFALR